MKFSGFLLFLCAVVTLQSCEIINPEEKVPTYVHIDSFSFVPTLNTGTSSHKITSVWAYFDNQPLGAFDLPANIPVLTDVPGVLLVTPGVTYSGISDLQTKYSFYVSDTTTLTPSKGQVVHFQPETQYLAADVLNLTSEDFELGNSFSIVLGADTTLTRVSDPALVFEGSFAGYLYLKNKTLGESIMNTAFTASEDAFIELDYRSSINFEIGLQTTSSTGQLFSTYLYGFRPKSEWNKVYIGLQDFIGAYPNRSYRVVIRARSDTPLEGFVSIDNLKVISIKQ